MAYQGICGPMSTDKPGCIVMEHCNPKNCKPTNHIPTDLGPICGSDGITYPHYCAYMCVRCDNPELNYANCGTTSGTTTTTTTPKCVENCPETFQPGMN